MRIVFVTAPPDEAPRLLRQLVEERLVAGGNIIPGVRSIYWWQGEVQDEPESVLLMETAEDRVPLMVARLRALHSYDVPKILTFTPREGPADYLGWVVAQTRPESGGGET